MGNAGDVFTPEGWYMSVSSRTGCYRKSSIDKTRTMPFDLDLAELRDPSFKVEPPAFHLHSWFPGEWFGTVVTHQVPIGTFDGPHPFFGPDGKLL